MKKGILLLTFVFMLISSFACASTTQFNQPVYIGSYATTKAGGPSPAFAKGYSSRTYDSFTFGQGEDSLTFKFENNYFNGRATSSRTKGVYIGKNLVTKSIVACPEIYKITDNMGRIFYIGKGITSGTEQVFLLMGKCAGSYYNVIKIEDLQRYCTDIKFMDHNGAPHIGNIYTQGNAIKVPYTRKYNNVNYKAGEFIFEWDSNFQWFTINHIVY